MLLITLHQRIKIFKFSNYQMFNLRIRLIVNINKIDIHLCGIILKTISLFSDTMSLGDINYKRQGKK